MVPAPGWEVMQAQLLQKGTNAGGNVATLATAKVHAHRCVVTLALAKVHAQAACLDAACLDAAPVCREAWHLPRGRGCPPSWVVHLPTPHVGRSGLVAPLVGRR